MTFAWALPLVVLLGVNGTGGGLSSGPGLAAGLGWLALPVALLAHDLACRLWHGLRSRRAPGAGLAHGHDEAMPMFARGSALLVAAACTSAAWQWQSSLAEVPWPHAGTALAPVLLQGLLPALLLGAPPAGLRALLGRHLQFAACTLVAALLAMLQPTLGPWLPFVLACVGSAALSAALAPRAMTVGFARPDDPADTPDPE